MLRAFYAILRGPQTQQKFPDIQYLNFIQEIEFFIKFQFIYAFIVQNKVENGYVDKEELDRVRREMEAHYRLELNRKLEDVNNYLEEQSRARERLDNSRDETEYKLKDDKKKIQVGGPELSDRQIPDITPVHKLLLVIRYVTDVLWAQSRFVKFVGGEAAGWTPYTFYKPTLVPKYVSNRPYNEFVTLTTFF